MSIEQHRAGAIDPPAERSGAFIVALSATIVLILARSPAVLVVLGWFLGPYEEASSAGVLSHRIHEVAFGILFSWALVGAMAQWRSPQRNIAAMLQLILALSVFSVVVTAITGAFEWLSLLILIPAAASAALHPAGARTLLLPRFAPSAPLLALGLLATPWLITEAAGEVSLAVNRAQGHTSHWAAMSAFLLLLALLGLLAGLRPPGHRVVAASVGVGSVLFGLTGLLFPFDASQERGWPFLVAWGVLWIIAASRFERSAVARSPMRSFARSGGLGFAMLSGLVVMIALSSMPPNVPHNLADVPDVGAVAWPQADRSTCLTCHAGGLEGAVVVTHPFRTCGGDGEACIEARSDCLGCHWFDPALGGSSEMVATFGAPSPFATVDVYGAALASAEIRALQSALRGQAGR